MPTRRQAIDDLRASGGSVTIADVARLAGVSQTTVSRVLNGQRGLVSRATFRRVERVIEELDYQPTALGRALRQGQSNLVALFLPDTQNPFYSAIADSIEVCLQQDGLNLVLCNTREDAAMQDAALRQLLSFRVRCFIMLGAVDSAGLRDAAERNTPFLFINRLPPAGIAAPFIGIDNYAAGADIARYLVPRALTEVGVVSGPSRSSASRSRYEGFRDTMAALGHPIRPDNTWQSELTIKGGYDLGAAIIGRAGMPRAIFCANDLISYGLHKRATENGVRVPDDLFIVGFDDNPLNRWLAPWLVSVQVPYQEFGPIVRSIIVGSNLPAADQIILPHHIVERHNETAAD
ncbi:MAG: LacI family transcriptional regulator [Rhodobacteraceae bacterium]|nr:LacI family transcriptional regulator [Paracoccaceae bacterium]